MSWAAREPCSEHTLVLSLVSGRLPLADLIPPGLSINRQSLLSCQGWPIKIGRYSADERRVIDSKQALPEEK